MVIQSSHLPLEQLNYGGGTFEYGTNMTGGGKRRRKRTNKKKRSTKRKIRRSKGKLTIKHSSKKRKTLAQLRAQLKKYN